MTRTQRAFWTVFGAVSGVTYVLAGFGLLISRVDVSRRSLSQFWQRRRKPEPAVVSEFPNMPNPSTEKRLQEEVVEILEGSSDEDESQDENDEVLVLESDEELDEEQNEELNEELDELDEELDEEPNEEPNDEPNEEPDEEPDEEPSKRFSVFRRRKSQTRMDEEKGMPF